MTPKEKEQALRDKIDELTSKIDRVLELLEKKNGKAKASK